MPSRDQETTLGIEILELGFAEKLAGLGVVRLTREDLIALAASSRTVEIRVYGALVIDDGLEGK